MQKADAYGRTSFPTTEVKLDVLIISGGVEGTFKSLPQRLGRRFGLPASGARKYGRCMSALLIGCIWLLRSQGLKIGNQSINDGSAAS